jgi:hypothetical protein
MNILAAMRDPKVFGQYFRDVSWKAWFAFAASLFALPMTTEQLAIYQRHTGRIAPPTTSSHEAWLCIGRRGGKSFFLAVIAVFLACFKDWRPYLGPGEVGTVMVIAADRRQARVIMRYIIGLLKNVPMLARQIESVTRESISLKNRIAVEIHTASFRTTRGYTIVAALLDEAAYWPTDESSAEPDIEVINAIRPGMATIPDAMLLVASSPHARRGALWAAHRKHYGKDGDPVLVWQAATRDMNPSVPQSYIDQHIADDPARAAAEYGAQFRTDLEAFVSIEAVRACVAANVFERSPVRNVAYVGFVDPSGGSSDSFTLAIGHIEYNRETVVLDCLREQRPPFSPEIVTSEFAALLKTYRLSSVTGDRYAGEWPVEQFAKYGVRYVAAEKPKSELYTDLLPLINSRRIDLLDHPKLINQLCSLERRTARGGRDSIDHPPNAHDDVANVSAGLASLAITKGVYNPRAWTDDTPDDPHGIEAWRRARLSWYLHSGGIPPPF